LRIPVAELRALRMQLTNARNDLHQFYSITTISLFGTYGFQPQTRLEDTVVTKNATINYIILKGCSVSKVIITSWGIFIWRVWRL